MLYAIVGLLVVIVDQWVKYWVSGAINPESTGEAFIPGILSLVNVHNDGAAFSFLAGSNARIPFIIITGVFIVAVIIALATKFISGKFARWCLVLVTAGGLGNCIDRVIYGYVQDMFKCELFNFPIFNVADIFITVFAILFVLAVLFERKTVYDDYEDEFSLEDDEEDDYDDEEDLRAARKARKAEKRDARKARKAARIDEDEDDEEEEPVRPTRKSRKERAEEAYLQAQAEAEAARKRADEAAAAAARRKAAQTAEQPKASAVEDPFAEWERANARAGVQSPRRTARTQTPVAPAASTPTAQSAVKPAASAAKPAAPKPQAPAKKPAPVAAEEDFSLDDILAEFK
ncbi:MAG: signal peptidase II [Oscillospiraceae bacterium]|nr:signal peptidase II [Oscillospiraceae bacterium]